MHIPYIFSIQNFIITTGNHPITTGNHPGLVGIVHDWEESTRRGNVYGGNRLVTIICKKDAIFPKNEHIF